MDIPQIKRRVLTPEQVYVKLRHYCAYQERTHQEVKQKIAGYGLSWTHANEMASRLIEDGFLNEERFARAFAGGKFRTKGWGRKKIEVELKKRRLSEYTIKKAMREEIPTEAYERTLMKLLEKKWNALKKTTETHLSKQAKVKQYLFSRGFEGEIISRLFRSFIEKNNP